MNFEGLLVGVFTFLIIGVSHPIVIKTEYYFGTRPWWIYLLTGLAALGAALFVEDMIISSLLGVLSFTAFWAIKELFEQEQRVERGWFPRNPKRHYKFDDKNERKRKYQTNIRHRRDILRHKLHVSQHHTPTNSRHNRQP